MVDAEQQYWLGIAAEKHAKELGGIGFSLPLSSGERFLPAEDGGPASRRNAIGDVVVHRDRPMETAYRQVEWHGTEFRGRYDTEERAKIVDVPYKRYPRTLVPPYAVELEIRPNAEGILYAVAGPFTHDPGYEREAANTLNLFIELFGECEVLTPRMTAWLKVPIQQLNWQLLPPGKNPWGAAKPALERVISRADEGNQPVVRARFDTIGDHDPAFVAIGKGGFEGYVVFGFPALHLCILECRSVNNATYVLNEESWETVIDAD
jgi:hypothetical protein